MEKKMNIKRITTLMTLGASLFTVSAARAEPMSPKDKNVAADFSVNVQNEFELLADTEDDSLVYYIPRQGNVLVQSPQSASPRPRFNVSSRAMRFGVMAKLFPGEEFTYVGGVLSTTGNLGALLRLQDEARALGYRVAPSPVSSSAVKFMAMGTLDPEGSGRIDVRCDLEEDPDVIVDGEPLAVPKCYTRSNPDGEYDINTNAIYKLNSSRAPRNGTVARDIRFRSVIFPTFTDSIMDTMMVGGSWDDVLGAQVKWKVLAQRKTHQARVTVRWKRLFEQASSFVAMHLNSCFELELKAFFQKIVDCNNPNECGVFVEYRRPGGGWTDEAPNNADFVAVVNEVEAALRDQLFNEILPTSSKLGQVSDSVSSQFTLRANYEKRIVRRNETIRVRYNPGAEDVDVATDFGIDCLMGGFGDRVSWNLDDPGCAAILGQ